jgi:spermidine synthase
MLPWKVIGRSKAASGGELVLSERGGEYSLRINGWELMSSRKHGSEDAMAEVGLAGLTNAAAAHVLVAGLGIGFSLRATLDQLPKTAKVTVAEYVPAIVEWNRGVLGPLAGNPLADPRVTLVVGDVRDVMRKHPGGFDAILLDTDNNETAFTDLSPAALYGPAGLKDARKALRPKGTLVIWSAGPDVKFEKRLGQAGFRAESIVAPAQGNGKGAKHVLFTGRLP